jgi:hypothetical protein
MQYVLTEEEFAAYKAWKDSGAPTLEEAMKKLEQVLRTQTTIHVIPTNGPEIYTPVHHVCLSLEKTTSEALGAARRASGSDYFENFYVQLGPLLTLVGKFAQITKFI